MSQQDFIGAEDADWMATNSKNYVHHTSTDVIISSYENKIGQNIASKILSASKSGKAPEFTKEEVLYLNKKSGENDDTELKVITPTPVITLKKGKTELNIGHAATLVQKMEEKYPTGKKKVVEVFNSPEENVEVVHHLSSTPPTSSVAVSQPQPEIKSVNKNAYEIREAVLAHALSWVQYAQEFKHPPCSAPTEDDVLAVAQKFYKFVENRR